MSAMVHCQRCNASSEAGKRFCGECGAPLDPAFAELRQYLNFAVREEVRSVIKSDYKDQHYLELTTTQAVVERISSWTKMFAAVVAIPLGLVLFILGGVGLKTYSDFTHQLEVAQSNVTAKLDAAESLASKLQTDGATLSADYEKLKIELANSKNVAGDVERLTAEYKKLANDVAETAGLSETVDRLKSRVTGIEDSIRSALLIGNADYASLPKLKTAANDANDLGQAFGEIGYKVTTRTDSDRRGMSEAINNFGQSVSPGDTVVFYYSGHGVQIDGKNYLIPTDTMASGLSIDSIIDRALSLEDVTSMLLVKNPRAVIMIIDACRNNPFGAGESRGLAIIGPQPPGIFMLFSASSGQVALDSYDDLDGGRNSLFAHALLPQIKQKDLSIEDLGKAVRTQVAELASRVGVRQQPDYVNKADGPIYLAGRNSQ